MVFLNLFSDNETNLLQIKWVNHSQTLTQHTHLPRYCFLFFFFSSQFITLDSLPELKKENKYENFMYMWETGQSNACSLVSGDSIHTKDSTIKIMYFEISNMTLQSMKCSTSCLKIVDSSVATSELLNRLSWNMTLINQCWGAIRSVQQAILK